MNVLVVLLVGLVPEAVVVVVEVVEAVLRPEV